MNAPPGVMICALLFVLGIEVVTVKAVLPTTDVPVAPAPVYNETVAPDKLPTAFPILKLSGL